ncbi:MAG: winged helix-turn-helix transcriptional regulator [Gammaproteobacteria bacterium]
MTKEREETLTLEILQAIEARSDVTQRHLADRMGVALGLANSYLKRCVRKGLVKITQAPANRYLYYLTPSGLAEKGRLTAQYLTYSLDFYRRASAAMAAAFAQCEQRGWNRVLLGGMSELAEVASVRAHDFNIEVIGTFDPATIATRFVGRPVWSRVEELPAADACVYSALGAQVAAYAALVAHFGPERVVVPEILRSIVSAGASSSTTA